MSENNLDIETQSLPSLSDGTEILSSTRARNKRGVSRRDFLKLLGATLPSLLMGCLPPDQPQSGLKSALLTSTAPSSTDIAEQAPPQERFLQPELLHNVEVYGLGEKITSEDQITRLYGFLDKKFAKENNITIGNKVEQRKKLLNPNERYLEVVVRQSAFDSFLRRQQETGADFVDWIQMHVDAMNRCFENAKPPADMKSVLRRIVVVSDDMPKNFWNKSEYRAGRANALDVAWGNEFKDKYPIDTDCSWAIADDYRSDQVMTVGWSYYQDKKGNVIFRYPPKGEVIKKRYTYPKKDDLLQTKEGVWMDFALTHEWSHYLTNLPDQDFFNIHDKSPSRFSNFLVVTGGNFQEPYLSPYLSMFLSENVRRKARSYFYQHEVRNLSERPTNVTMNFTDTSGDVNNIRIHKVVVEGGYRGHKTFPESPNQKVTGDQVILDRSLFDDRVGDGAHVWLLKVATSNHERQLFLPAAAFQMTKFAGVDDANYRIEFTGYDDPNKKNQIMDMVDDSDLQNYLKTKNNSGEQLYTKMKVDGTNTWFVWFLRD